MTICDIVMKMPCYYKLIIVVFSLYYAIRGIIEQKAADAKNYYKNVKKYNKTQKVIVVYIQEILFKVIITASSFVALFIANYIFSSFKSFNDIGAGTAALLIFLIAWGTIGVIGYLTHIIVSGKFPK